MISQMRAHFRKIDKILREFPAQSDKWQMWLDYHQFQLVYFQHSRDNYVLAANVTVLLAVALIIAAVFAGDAYVLWILAGLAACVLVGLEYYLYLYNDLMHLMEVQTEKLFAKVLAIETKPNRAVAKHILDMTGDVVSGWSAWLKSRSRNERQ